MVFFTQKVQMHLFEKINLGVLSVILFSYQKNTTPTTFEKPHFRNCIVDPVGYQFNDHPKDWPEVIIKSSVYLP